MKTKLKIIAGALLAALVVGCASFATNTFRTEQTAVSAVLTAYSGYTNALLNGTLKISSTQSNEIKSARLKFAASVSVLEQWRESYRTNSAVKPQAEAALSAVLENSSNIVYLISFLKGGQTP